MTSKTTWRWSTAAAICSAILAARTRKLDRGDFSRVSRAKLDCFTVERLIAMLEGLGQQVEVSVDVLSREALAVGRQQSI